MAQTRPLLVRALPQSLHLWKRRLVCALHAAGQRHPFFLVGGAVDANLSMVGRIHSDLLHVVGLVLVCVGVGLRALARVGAGGGGRLVLKVLVGGRLLDGGRLALDPHELNRLLQLLLVLGLDGGALGLDGGVLGLDGERLVGLHGGQLVDGLDGGGALASLEALLQLRLRRSVHSAVLVPSSPGLVRFVGATASAGVIGGGGVLGDVLGDVLGVGGAANGLEDELHQHVDVDCSGRRRLRSAVTRRPRASCVGACVWRKKECENSGDS